VIRQDSYLLLLIVKKIVLSPNGQNGLFVLPTAKLLVFSNVTENSITRKLTARKSLKKSKLALMNHSPATFARYQIGLAGQIALESVVAAFQHENGSCMHVPIRTVKTFLRKMNSVTPSVAK